METKSDALILAAGDFATELLDAIARQHPDMRADVERATAGGATLVVEVRFDVASVTAALGSFAVRTAKAPRLRT